MAYVLITGGTGAIGQRLTQKLREKGHDVHLFSRQANDDHTHLWNWKKGIVDQKALFEADYIIHLAGAGIFDKAWSPERKELILNSRVSSAQLLFEKVRASGSRPKAFICASAVGFYGAQTNDHIYTEEDVPAFDFLGQVCVKWETMADRFNDLGIRTVKIRTGVVLSGDALIVKKTALAVRAGFGAQFGNGQQYLPWIHVDDLCEIYLKAITDEKMSGAYNAVAPNPVTNAEFTDVTSRLLNKKLLFKKVPAALLRLVFGERAILLLTGSRISSIKISDAGYIFHFPYLQGALAQILSGH